MTFRFYQCQRPTCRFRFPALEVDAGYTCPKCGAPATVINDLLPSKGNVDEKDYPVTIAVLLDNIRSAYNVGSIFRTADGAGVSEIILCGITPAPDHTGVRKTSLGAESSIPWKQTWNAMDVCREYKEAGFQIFVLEKIAGATALPELKIGFGSSKILLVVGNENSGIDPEILRLADNIIFIPMAGQKESLNVSVAFGICIYWMVMNSNTA